MEVSSLSQLYVFAISLGAGVLCGMFFDIQRSLRKKLHAGEWRTALEDVIFILFCIGITLSVGYFFDEGAVRYYLILGSISGALFYAAFLSGIFMKICGEILDLIVKLILVPAKKIFKSALYPIKKIWILRKRFSSKRRKIVKNIFSKLKRRTKKLKKRIKML